MDLTGKRERKRKRTGLKFEDTCQSRNLDHLMTATGIARQEQEEAYFSNNRPIQQPNINHSASPFKNYKNRDDKHLPFKKRSRSMEKELPVKIRNMILGRMGGSCLLFVSEKALTKIDVRQENSSFRIYKTQIENEFLSKEENAKVEEGINVKLLIFNHDYQPSSSDEIQVKDIKLTRWPIRTSYSYAFHQHWNPLVQEYNLREDMRVQLWAFRVQTQIHFALVKL